MFSFIPLHKPKTVMDINNITGTTLLLLKIIVLKFQKMANIKKNYKWVFNR